MVKNYKIIQIIIALMGLSGFIFPVSIYYCNSSLDIMEKESNKALKFNNEITGFQFTSVKESQNCLSIKADKLTVHKKKLGFFRFAVMKEIWLENSYVRFNGINIADKNRKIAQSDNVIFEEIFSENIFQAIPVKRIASVIMKPVNMELHIDNFLKTIVSADYAIIQLKERNILFKNNVKVVSGYKTLITDKLNFKLEKLLFVTNQKFIFESLDKKTEGTKLTVNIHLTSLNI